MLSRSYLNKLDENCESEDDRKTAENLFYIVVPAITTIILVMLARQTEHLRHGYVERVFMTFTMFTLTVLVLGGICLGYRVWLRRRIRVLHDQLEDNRNQGSCGKRSLEECKRVCDVLVARELRLLSRLWLCRDDAIDLSLRGLALFAVWIIWCAVRTMGTP
jgi:hypothetical protein